MTSAVVEGGGDIEAVDEMVHFDDLSIDVDTLLDILEEHSCGPSQNVGAEDAGDLLKFQIHSGSEDPGVSKTGPVMFSGSGDLDYGNPSFVSRSRVGQSSMSLNDCKMEQVSMLQPDVASFQDGSFEFFSAQAAYTDASWDMDTNFTHGNCPFTGKSNVASANQHTNGCDIYNISGAYGEFSEDFGSMQFANGADYTQTPPYSFLLDDDYEIKYSDGCVNSVTDQRKLIHAKSASIASSISLVDQSDKNGQCLESEGCGHMLPVNGHIPFAYYHPGHFKEQTFVTMEEVIDSKDAHMICHVNELTPQVVHSISDCRNLLSGTSALAVQDSNAVSPAIRESQVGDGAAKFPMNYLKSRLHLRSNELFKGVIPEREHKPVMIISSYPSTVSPESTQSNSSSSRSYVDNNSDVCIVEDMSRSNGCYISPAPEKAIVPQHTTHYDQYHTGVGSTKCRTMDERNVLRVALQDLSQPKSETTPPNGLLAVPLLRHQRIALSWMVQKETSSLYCSGGILADDQGLGKTVSTIALLLKERSPAPRVDGQDIIKEEVETLDSDDDDDVTEVGGKRQKSDDCQVMSYRKLMRERESCGRSKGRPSCGTLVVCPTSVLRQWADELHKKVTKEANLSVLVYHGGNRTKDPLELAKYDVVLTTYSIVSMEVPKQPVVDKEADEKAWIKREDAEFFELSFGKKRKYPSGGKKDSKSKKGTSDAMLESTARPLAKVAWFRVVLDEAQSIKNHRTQVARACWGLRAKRRWCLSGTPIQNAIDDLYSYFRFLKYEPYAVYKSFISTIKIPIQKSPTRGYKKLQAVLRTIMLRRTKGTLLDGEPIINLPPKVIELKKVDFTDEERDFYSTLESNSRAQFKEYADAGTVKQNYVNILLMLLRLRQACDHPLLVGGVDSDSMAKYSVGMAKKLPREQQVHLLSCLEGSLAICGICNDPPEDAVVSVCGHVFCNQCICEHLTGDDNQCPIFKCKMKLNVSSVFSKATLSSCLSEQPGGSESELAKSRENHPARRSPVSSKISAALEVLKSLTKHEGHGPRDKCSVKSFVEDGCSRESSSMNSQSDHAEENPNQSNKDFGEKAIVFSQWTGMLDLVEACLKSSSIQYRRLDGTMSVTARDKAVKDFNTLPEVTVMIMSLKAASLGLNMVAACHVLLLDLWWNPTTEDQAIDRAHRIGQTRPVKVLRLTVRDTVEDRILALQRKKREMVASAFGEDETGGRQSRLTVDDLKYLFMA